MNDATTTSTKTTAAAPGTTSPEMVVRRLLEEGFSQGRTAVVDDLVAADSVEHQLREPGHPAGPAGVKAVIASLRRAFSDFRLTVEDLTVDGQVVWTRNLATGTHDGPFRGRPPTGRRISITVFDVMRVVDGRIVEHWGLPDHLTLLSQIAPDTTKAVDAQPARREP
jgi:predicted ester cyclase